jgi:hypothetical protein
MFTVDTFDLSNYSRVQRSVLIASDQTSMQPANVLNHGALDMQDDAT